ncbi:MAG TPA: tetratricopeptide repeat protein, partial [Kofleriaceae bacterium]|nr:tetratricopeptide repeat protein [Kofleriaceae bacterium]
QRAAGMPSQAEDTLFAAAAAAEAGRDGDATVNAWLELSRLVGETGARYPQAHRLARLARGAIERMGGDQKHEARLEDWIGRLHHAEKRLDQARTHLERGLSLRQRALGSEHFAVAESLQHLAALEESRGDRQRALALHSRAREIGEKARGPAHPDLLPFLRGEAGAQGALGRHAEALALVERGLIVAEAGGPTSEMAVAFLGHVGRARWKQGDHAGALAALEKRLAGLEQLAGAEHARLSAPLSELGRLLVDMGRAEASIARFQRAAAIARAHGADHPDLAAAIEGIGAAELARGLPERAIAPLEQAVAMRERGESARDLAAARQLLARALARAGKSGRARRLLEAARDGFEKAGDAEAAAAAAEELRGGTLGAREGRENRGERGQSRKPGKSNHAGRKGH